MASKEVKVKDDESKAVVTAGGFNYGEASRAGFEDTTTADLSIPFINLLQSNSPTVEEELIPGAKVGDMLNNVTNELIKGDKGFVFLPVHKDEKWVEWVPRLKGGGFVEAHDPSSDLVQELIRSNNGQRIPPKDAEGKRIGFKHNGNEIIETYYVYGLLLNEEGTEVNSMAVISFSSTKIKPYRDWITSMYLLKGKPPMFANRALIKSIKQKNEAGTYANYSINPLHDTWSNSLINPETESDLLQQAKEFREQIMAGVAKADYEKQDAPAASSAESKPASKDEEEAPF